MKFQRARFFRVQSGRENPWSIEPKLLTLKELEAATWRESAAQLAAFVQANQESRDLGPFADIIDECVNHTVGQDCGYCPAPSSSGPARASVLSRDRRELEYAHLWIQQLFQE